MNSGFWFLARKSGFAFWEREEWNQFNAVIDWSSNYDSEFQEYTKEVILHTIAYIDRNHSRISDETIDNILTNFGFKNDYTKQKSNT